MTKYNFEITYEINNYERLGPNNSGKLLGRSRNVVTLKITDRFGLA